MNVLEKISGKKTYAFSAALILLAVLDLSGLVPAETRTALYSTVGAAIAVALRLAVGKLPAETQAKIEHVRELAEQLQRERHKGLAAQVQQYRKDQRETPREHDGHSRVYLPLLLCLLNCCTAASADDIRIVGPSGVPAAGYPCDLYVQGELPEGTTIEWDHFPKRDGLPLIEAKDGGRTARLNTMAGEYKLIVAVAPPGAKPVIRYHDFKVPGTPFVPPSPIPPPAPEPPVPPPAPVPVPVPTPNPVPEPLPPGVFDISSSTYRLAVAVGRKTEAACLAEGCRGIVDQIRGGLSSPQAIVDAMTAAVDRCTSSDWDQARTALVNRIEQLFNAGRLQQPSDWATLLTEIRIGLEAAAR